MRGPGVAGGLQHLISADEIGLHIAARGLDRIAHPGLRGEVDDHPRPLRQTGHKARCFHQPLHRAKPRRLAQKRMARLLQADVVIGRHPVQPGDLPAIGQQAAAKVKADEPRGSRDQSPSFHAATPRTCTRTAPSRADHGRNQARRRPRRRGPFARGAGRDWNRPPGRGHGFLARHGRRMACVTGREWFWSSWRGSYGLPRG